MRSQNVSDLRLDTELEHCMIVLDYYTVFVIHLSVSEQQSLGFKGYLAWIIHKRMAIRINETFHH